MLVALAMAGCYAATIAGGQTAQPLRLPPFKAGETITFSFKSKYWNEPVSLVDQGGSSVIFDIKVLEVNARGARIVWTTWGEAGSGDELFNIPFEVDVDPTGAVRDVVNVDAVREKIFRRHPEFGPPDDSATLKHRIENQISDVLKRMSVLQSRDPIAFGHNDLGTAVYNESNIPGLQYFVARNMDLRRVDQGKCLAYFVRHTVQVCKYKGAPCETPTYTETSATVSTDDGWIVELHTFLKFAPGFRQTFDIHRLTPVTCRKQT
jgi:hypothetical protein